MGVGAQRRGGFVASSYGRGPGSVASNRVLVSPAASVVLPSARRLDDPDELRQARRLQAREYVRIGYLTPDSVGPDGMLTAEVDPWVPYSRYFGAFDSAGRIRATMRAIGNDAPWPLPTLQLPGIDPFARQVLAGLPAGRLAEVSALVRDGAVDVPFTRAVFRALWLDASACHVTHMVLSVDALVLRILRRMDHRVFRVVGTPSPAPVRPVLPVWTLPSDFQAATFTNGLVPDVVTLP